MDVATPTADCLNLVYELLLPVVSKPKNSLSHQEVRGFGLNFLLGDLLFFWICLSDFFHILIQSNNSISCENKKPSYLWSEKMGLFKLNYNTWYLQLLLVGLASTNISFCGSIIRSLVSYAFTSPTPYAHTSLPTSRTRKSEMLKTELHRISGFICFFFFFLRMVTIYFLFLNTSNLFHFLSYILIFISRFTFLSVF